MINNKQENDSNNMQRYEDACQVMPGGVNSPVRAFKGVGGVPVFMAKGEGAYLVDADGNRYLDLIGSWGPLILGHGHPAVVQSLQQQLLLGTSFGAPTVQETQLAKEMIARVPGLEMVRLVNSGTEATMSAVRLARGYTKRDLLLKFIGNYHGHGDSFLIQAGSGLATFGKPSSPGVTEGTASSTLTVAYNDIAAVERLVQEKGKQMAAIILEPVAGNMGCVPPVPGFLEKIRQLCSENGIVLIFDEVMTGFRLSSGGAAALYKVQPDLYTFGKVIGGGLPVGAYGGKKTLMSHISPMGDIYQAGTLSGNPLAVSAGLATLRQLDQPLYQKLEGLGQKMADGLRQISKKLGKTWTVNRVGSMLTLFFSHDSHSPTNFAQVAQCDMALFNRFFHSMLIRGFYLPPSGYESFFLSAAMEEEDIERFLDNAKQVLADF